MGLHTMAKILIHFLKERKEINNIEAAFQCLRLELGINKVELYKKSLLWVSKNEKYIEQFIEYLVKERAKIQIVEIAE